MLDAVVEMNAMPEQQVCTFCCENSADFRCVQCGPCCYYCKHCLSKLHLSTNLFRVPGEWKVSIDCLLAASANAKRYCYTCIDRMGHLCQ